MNTLHHYFVPQWLSVLFLLVIPTPVFLLAFLAKKGSNQKAFYAVLGFFGLYCCYVWWGSANGLFDTVAFPPTVLLYTTLPLALFLFLGVANTGWYQRIFQNLTLQDLIQVHIFRLIGVFFILLALHDALPKAFSLMAGIGDVLTAISSIYVARLVAKKAYNAQKMAFLWNTFGTLDILATAIGANLLTKISINTGTMGVDTLAQFPFCLIPALAPPIILFLHVAIYQKLKKF